MSSEHDELVKLILDFVNAQKYSTAINTRLEKAKKRVAWYDEGRSDIHMNLLGRFIGIEVKVGKDQVRRTQEDYIKRVEKANGECWVVRSYEQFCNLYFNKTHQMKI